MKWSIYPASEAARFAQQWDELNERSVKSPLLTSRYLLAALRTFGTGHEKLACLGSTESPDCMAVVCERKHGVWETFQPSQAPVGFLLMRANVEISDVLPGLVSALPGFPLLLGITQQDPVMRPRPSETARMRTLDYIETARIEVEGGFDAYWEQRGKNLRQNMRKARNKLEKADLAVRLDCINEPAAVKKAIANYGRLESGGWKATNGTAISLDNDQGRFYQVLFETHCQAGHGRIYQLMFNDAIAAMDLCVDLGDVIVILKTTYDEAMADYSPAILMHQMLFQALFESGEFKRIEFYGKVMDWHTRFTEDKRTMYHLNYYRWGWVKRLLFSKVVNDTQP